MKNPAVKILLICLPGIVFLLLWQWVVNDDARLQFLFASPLAVLQTAMIELGGQNIWHDILTTLSETLAGLLAGTILGTGCGLLLWGNGKIDTIARPYVVLLGAIPVFALAPIMIIWFGIGFLSKAVLSAFAVFFVSLAQAYEGAHATAAEYLTYAQSLRAVHGRVIAKIIIPGSWRWVMAGFRMNVGFALMGAFIGEFVSSEAGLGHYILKAGSLYDMPKVLFGVILMSLMAAFMTVLSSWLSKGMK